MPTSVSILLIFVALGAGVGIGFAIDRILRGAAYQRRDQILTSARTEAEAVCKTMELEAKADIIARREELDKEQNRIRDELREQERRLDRRESTLNELQQDMTKKERMAPEA